MANKNTEIHFQNTPKINIRRSLQDLSNRHTTTFNTGEAIPIFWTHVLPGDTFKAIESKITRTITPLFPVLDSAYQDTWYFFVPSRLLWNHYEEYRTRGGDKPNAWTNPTIYTKPVIRIPNEQVVPAQYWKNGSQKASYTQKGVREGDLLDYLGIPTDTELNSMDYKDVDALPVRAYYKIYNDYLRDENVAEPMLENTGDSVTTYVPEEKYLSGSGEAKITNGVTGSAVLRISKFHDVFTSALPAPEKGGSVLIPGLDGTSIGAIGIKEDLKDAITAYKTELTDAIFYDNELDDVAKVTTDHEAGTQLYENGPSGSSDTGSLSAVQGYMLNPGATIYALRNAIAVQQFNEALAQYGSRYTEFLHGIFNVESSDARLQRAEYLGGYRNVLNMTQVEQTSASTEDSPLGQTGAFSITNTRGKEIFTKSFSEDGIFMVITCVRTDHTYSQGIDKKWTHFSYLEEYNPLWANIGNQPIKSSEILVNSDVADSTIFGYQEAWYEYRFEQNKLSGQMRPYLDNSYGPWTYGDDFTAILDDNGVVLNDYFIKETRLNMDRTLAVESSNADQIMCQFYLDLKAYRPMPTFSVPGITKI